MNYPQFQKPKLYSIPKSKWAPLSFCGPNVIDHYFCDLHPLTKMSCSDTTLFELFAFCMTIIFTIPPFLLTLISYICITVSIIKINSTIGRQKAFSTCSSHLLVVCLFYGTSAIVYTLPDTSSLKHLNKIISVFYTVVTPLLNPLIYSLRNKDIHKAIGRLFNKNQCDISLNGNDGDRKGKPLTFCGPNVTDHYFCDLYPLMKLSCSDKSLFECFTFCMTIVFTIPPFLLTVTSYICIIITIINMKSTTGRHKAFSTCSSHLIVVYLFYGTLFIAYALPDTPTLRYLNKINSIFYTVMTPLSTEKTVLHSYICIIGSIIKIQSIIGRQNAFSTCSSHLMVVCLFYSTLIIVYISPDTPTLRHLNKFFSIFSTILTPLANPLIYTLRNKEFSFCGPNVIDHYFCDLSPLEKLSCSDPSLLKIIVFLLTFIFTLAPFFLTVSSYACIISSIIRIQSTIGRQKAFSTCSSHLMVVCLFYGTIIIVYMLPDTPTLRQLNKISIFYTILTPLANPLIYTLSNTEIHKASRRVQSKLSTFL
ncbi:Olfactory receptor 10A7, partial [Ophiophagus hannah]